MFNSFIIEQIFSFCSNLSSCLLSFYHNTKTIASRINIFEKKTHLCVTVVCVKIKNENLTEMFKMFEQMLVVKLVVQHTAEFIRLHNQII